MSTYTSYVNYISNILTTAGTLYDYTDKETNTATYVSYMLDRTQSMFNWTGLPSSIPQRILELYLQVNGNVCFYHVNDNLYVFNGGLGGEPDVYYRPTIYTIANPALKLSKSLKIGEECEIMLNDSLARGILPLCQRYATTMTETDLSIKLALINSRIIDLINAPDDRTKASAELFLEHIEDGELGVIAGNPFFDGIKTQPYGNASATGTLTDLIETMQYSKASWFNELGLNANYNMKRESLNTSESQMNNDALLPLVDDMLRCRRDACERVNAMYGTNISVDFASSWKDNEIEIDLEHAEIDTQNAEERGLDDVGMHAN